MKLLKPNWINHNGRPIFSLDIHPDGSRLATGGQGDDSGRVVIWNMLAIVDESAESNENVCKQLCQMDNHLACVNSVRWSQSGRFLATAGDDKVIIIWTIGARYAPQTNGFVGNVEQYRVVSTLRQHSGDILDLSWSPADNWLASCSVDNSVIVWNANKWSEVAVVLRGHTGLVKGITWDPIGKYLASQSDDKTLRIWRISDWTEEAVIEEPFEECGGTTHVLRLNWSPDGQFLVSAHAMNNLGSVAQIIERQNWSASRDFVGHRKAIACVRFNSNIMCLPYKHNANRSHKLCCIAIGSRDRSLSVWMTSRKRPILVLHDLFDNSVLDLSWSQSGFQLMACSWDGTVAYMEFTEQEIGCPMTSDEKVLYKQKLYGVSKSSSSPQHQLIEDPDIMVIHEQKKKFNHQNGGQSSNESSNRMATNNNTGNEPSLSNSQSSKLSKGPTDKQVEVRLADGRRRITPLYIPPIDGMTFCVQPTTFSSSSEPKTKIYIEKHDESNSRSSIGSSPVKQQQQPLSSQNATTNGTPLTPTQQQTTSTKSLPNMNTEPIRVVNNNNNNNKSDTNDTNGISKVKDIKTTIIDADTGDQQQSLPTPKRKHSATTDVSNNSKTKRGRPSIPGSGGGGGGSGSSSKDITTTTTSPKNDLTAKNTYEAERQTINKIIDKPAIPIQVKDKHPSMVAKHQTAASKLAKDGGGVGGSGGGWAHSSAASDHHYLPVLKMDKTATVKVFSACDKYDRKNNISIDIENSISSSKISALRLNSNGDRQWQILVSANIIAVTGSDQLIACACNDRTLSVFSTSTGRRLQAPIMLSSPVARLTCHNSKIMAITVQAVLWMWDFSRHRVLIKGESLAPLLNNTHDVSILSTGITDCDSPLICLSSGKSYVFDEQFGSWTLIANSNDVLNTCTDQKPHSFDPSSLPLSTIQSQTRTNKSMHTLFLSDSTLQQSAVLSYIDQQLAASFVIGSAKEYRFWMLALAQHLSKENMENRLRELCQYLIGPIFKSIRSQWEPKIVGNGKHDLLKEVLAILSTNLRLQRLYTEFKEQLDHQTMSVAL
ncbi:protein HIRA-like [Oppia nitens]|uniref:protein HIRA-like n=1 Tax=Oppia nitens TaxID=1686743 RepID=UPI0023DBEDDE|nr:protein HIRA-like [Oppia nitens]